MLQTCFKSSLFFFNKHRVLYLELIDFRTHSSDYSLLEFSVFRKLKTATLIVDLCIYLCVRIYAYIFVYMYTHMSLSLY